MYTRAVFIAGSLMLATGSTSAIAADIYAPSAGGLKDSAIQEQVILPEATAFQEDAEWYIRGDVGVGIFSDIDGHGYAAGGAIAVDGLDYETFFSAGIGFGRYVTPNVRLGLDIDYRHNASSTFNTGNPAGIAALTNLGTIPLELTTTAVMFNAVYDFAPQRRWSPYVGGGIGWAFHNLEFNGGSYTNDVDPVDAINENGTVAGNNASSSSFAASLVAGVSVNIRQGLYVDMGYKFSYLGDADMDFSVSHSGVGAYASDATIGINDIMTHEFKVGLRYDLY